MTTCVAQLDRVGDELRAAQARVSALASGASDATWNARPPSGGWSASECVAHLTLTTDAYIPLLTAAAARVPPNAMMPAQYKRGVTVALLEWMFEPPARMKSKTIAPFVPSADAPKAHVVAAFSASQGTLLAWIAEHARVPLDRVKVASPFNARIAYNAYGALRIMAAHQRRHVWQAERALRGEP